MMTILTKLSEKAKQWCVESGFDIDKVQNAMNSCQFWVVRCDTKAEMREHGVDQNYPYIIVNPYDYRYKKEQR